MAAGYQSQKQGVGGISVPVVLVALCAAGSAQAGVSQVTMAVSARVIENCSALLSSSTTAIAASTACQGSNVVTTLAPTVSSASLAMLAPLVLATGQSLGAGLSSGAAVPAGAIAGGVQPAPASGGASKRAVTQQFVGFDGPAAVGSAASDFIVSAADDNSQIVMVTY